MITLSQFVAQTLTRIEQATLFFVGGTMKSGTTWMQLLLDAHPEVSCGGEAHFFDDLFPNMLTFLENYSRGIRHKNETLFKDVAAYPTFEMPESLTLLHLAAALLMSKKAGGKPAKAIGEKTPNTVSRLNEAKWFYPQMRFIHMVRDGRDGAVSGWFHARRLQLDVVAEAGDQSRSVQSFADYVAVYAKEWAGELALGEDFAGKWPDRYLQVRYEDLQADAPGQFARVCRFLEVSDDPAVISRCCAATSFEALSGGRAPGVENRQSFFRKGEAGDWKNHFDAETLALFRRHAGDWLDRLGYGEA